MMRSKWVRCANANALLLRQPRHQFLGLRHTFDFILSDTLVGLMVQLQIRIGEQTSAEDIVSWPLPYGAEIIFLVLKSSNFEAGAEGIALSYLASALNRGAVLGVYCESALPSDERSFLDSVFCTTFGFALIRSAKSTRISSSRDDFTKQFRIFAGRIYDRCKGQLGLGDRVELIAFDPKRRVPNAILSKSQSVDRDGLPLPSAFQGELLRVLTSMGLPELGSQTTLPTILSFVYELFLNTVQHGLPSRPESLIFSTRGIALTKIAYNVSQLESRKISQSQREYLLRVAEAQNREANLLVACISIMDMGDGIHFTLPLRADDEAPGQRLVRAFAVGQSRKSESSVERGVGLHKVVEAAFHLGARLEVHTANLSLTKDYSFWENRLLTVDDSVPAELPEHFNAGTSVTLYVPNIPTNVDQRSLSL